MSQAKTAVEKLMQGTQRKDRETPKLNVGGAYSFPHCPKHLKGGHRKIWTEVNKAMTQYKLITLADKPLLEQYCFLLAKLRSEPDAFTASLHAQLRGVASDLCLTPESRAKAKLGAIDTEADLLAKYSL
jgi:phage terminase small subunit